MLNRLSRADRLSGAGALLALLATLLPWYHFQDGSYSVTTNGVGAGFLGDVVFLAGAAMLLVLLVRHDVIAVRARLDGRRVDNVVGFGALAAALLQALIGVNGSGAFHHATLGLVAAIAGGGLMAMGAWLRGEEIATHRTSPRRR